MNSPGEPSPISPSASLIKAGPSSPSAIVDNQTAALQSGLNDAHQRWPARDKKADDENSNLRVWFCHACCKLCLLTRCRHCVDVRAQASRRWCGTPPRNLACISEHIRLISNSRAMLMGPTSGRVDPLGIAASARMLEQLFFHLRHHRVNTL